MVFTPTLTFLANGIFQVPNGAVGAPGYSFNSDPDTGWYRSAADVMSLASGGVESLRIGGGRAYVGDGLVGSPSWSFINDPDTGIYSFGGDVLGFSSGGVVRGILYSAGFEMQGTSVFLSSPGTALLPAFSFAGDTNSGFYRSNADEVAIATAGVRRAVIYSAGFQLDNGSFFAPDGTVAPPAYTFVNDTNTGIYRQGADNMRIAAGGIDIWGFASAAGTPLNQPFGIIQSIVDGAVGAPMYSFNNDPDTGIYRIGADQLGFATGGVLRLNISTAAFTGTLPWQGQNGSAGTPAYSFSGDPDTGMYNGGANFLGFTAGGVFIFGAVTIAGAGQIQVELLLLPLTLLTAI
jgi:hypothetical protein